MGQKKPSWVKSNLPQNIKVKLWGIMRQTNTYPNFCGYLADNPDSLTDDEWKQLDTARETINGKRESVKSTITQDTYRNLIKEIRGMPLREVALLPKEIENWARGIRGDTRLELNIGLVIESQEDHIKDLACAAKRLADNLKPYLLKYSGCLGDYVVGSEEEIDLEEQLLLDAPTRWLLSHMKAELPELRNLNSWLDIPVEEINDRLLDRLYLNAAQKAFIGECNVCEHWTASP